MPVRRSAMLALSALLLLVFSLAFPRPAVSYPLLATDLIFLLLLALCLMEVARGRLRLQWRPAYLVLAAYVLALAPSLLVSPDPGASLLKLSATAYLAALTVIVDQLVRSDDDLRHVVRWWLSGTAVVAAIGAASLLVYPFAKDGWLINLTRYHFGTLPPGDYPRLAVTFFNANMLCNYLTVSLGLLLLARQRGWLGKPAFLALLGGVLLTAVATISPGLGGVLLALGLWAWLLNRRSAPVRARAALLAGLFAAAAFTVALAVTPIAHPTAPFRFDLPGDLTLWPSGRFLTWSAAAKDWWSHPLLGHGLGMDAVRVRYLDPSGSAQALTDAHNVLLNLGAQAGLMGVVGLLGLLALAIRLASRKSLASAALGLLFLNAFFYQGLGGSFEDARYLWVLLGLLLAADRLAGSTEGVTKSETAR